MVVEPLWLAAGVSAAVQALTVVPHPLVTAIEALGSRVMLLLVAVTARDPVPATVKLTAMAVPPSMIVWLPLAVTFTVGAAGLLTVTANVVDAGRMPPSVALIVRCAIPVCPIVGVITKSQLSVVVPHPLVAATSPAAPTLTSALLSVPAVTVSAPTPVSVNGNGLELWPPTDRKS